MKQKVYSIFMLVILITSSCENFLEKEPIDFLSPTNYFETEADLNSALAGTYDALGAFYGSVWLYRAGIEADEGYFARTSPIIGPQSFDFSSSFGDVTNFWNILFRGINRANVLIQNVDKNKEISEDFRNRIRGEALFLRGYYYFLLVQSWGGVPIFTTPTASVTNTDAARNTAAEVYAQVLSDMTTSETLVPNINAIGNSGRISKSAVRGILARVCLNMAGEPLKDVSKYVDARDWAKKVMDDTEFTHALNPSYSDIFIKIARDEYDIKESIFEVEFWGNATGGYTETGYVGFANGPQTSNTATGNGFGGVRATTKLYRKYEDNDVRRDWAIANFNYVNTGANGAKSLITTAATDVLIYNRQAAKFRREYEVVLPKGTGQTPQNFPLLRYADVLLMFAEAENEINNGATVEGLEAINKVRRRAFGKLLPGAVNINQYDLTSTEYLTFKSNVQDERMRELAFEQLRKSDLIRWGIFAFEMNLVLQNIDQQFPGTKPYYRNRFQNAQESRHLLWPIPAGDIVLNKLLTQNPGW